MKRSSKTALLVALLSSAAMSPAFANLAEERRQEVEAKIERSKLHDDCIQQYQALVDSTNLDDAAKVKSMSPRYTDKDYACGDSMASTILNETMSGLNEGLLEASGIGQVRDIVGWFQGRSLDEIYPNGVPLVYMASPGASLPPEVQQQLAQGRSLEETFGSLYTLADLVANGYQTHAVKATCLRDGWCDGTNYPGRGIVPPSQNPGADVLVNDILDASAAVAQRSDNLIVKGVGTAAPAFGPGRSLGQALDWAVDDPMGDADFLGRAAGSGLGVLGGAVTGTLAAALMLTKQLPANW